MDRFSIALCTYNGSEFLEQQLNSFICQERQPDEIIICDDQSTDQSLEIIKSFSRNAPFEVKYFLNEKRLGIVKNFEKTINLCTGNLIALSDQDDVWHSKKIERYEKIFNNRPDVGILFSNAEIVDSSLIPLGYDMFDRVNFSPKKQKRLINDNGLAVLLKHYIVTGATMCFRSDFKPAVLPIPSCWFHDTWIAIVIASISKMTFIREPMIKYRQHSGNQLGGVQKGLVRQIIEAFNINRDDYYKIEIQRYSLALNRLRDLSDNYSVLENIFLLNEKIKHLQVRASMSKNRFFRIPVILKEILKRGYYRYSRNWGSIAMDFFFK